MATWHKGADPLLASDIQALASTVSRHTHTCRLGEEPGAAMAAAVAATAGPGGAGGSRVATLIVPHDLSWQRGQPADAVTADADASGGSQGATAVEPLTAPAAGGGELAAARFVRDAAAALKACPRGRAAIYLGGRAGLAEGALPRRLRQCFSAEPALPASNAC